MLCIYLNTTQGFRRRRIDPVERFPHQLRSLPNSRPAKRRGAAGEWDSASSSPIVGGEPAGARRDDANLESHAG